MLSTGTVTLAAALAVTSAIPTIPTLGPAAPRTNGIVATAEGTVYFVDSFRNTVWRVLPGGAPAPFVTGRNGRSLQIGDDGSIYGLHEDDHGELTVWRADSAGTVSDVVRPAVPDGYGTGFVVDDAGAIIGVSGGGSRSGVRPIGALTRSHDDGVLLVTSGATVRSVASDGSVSTVVANERLLEPKYGFLSRLFGGVDDHLSGIAIGRDGEIYVANTARRTVVRIARDGTASVVAESSAGWSPTGVATSGGVLYVLEYGPGVRVRRIAPDGRARVLAQIRPQHVHSSTVAASALRFIRPT